jgi:3D (Asp-Asp-Asp) domain-containing protein
MTQRERDNILRLLVISALLAVVVFVMAVCDTRRTTKETTEDALTQATAAQEAQNDAEWDEGEGAEESVSESPVIAHTDIEPIGLWSLGEYKLTAYCSCEKCCGYWATIRPLDGEGNPIVYTSDGSVAKQGVTVAADTDILPFGTVLLIDGREYTVQDRGGDIKGKRIDVYFDSHEDALEFGVKVMEIFKKEEM